MPRTASDSALRRNFHIPLPDDLYRALQAEASNSKKPANAVAREAIAHWLELRRQARIDEAILAYAAAVAGTQHDLDPDLEARSLELLEDDA
jgi:predicted transcriptional regulator